MTDDLKVPQVPEATPEDPEDVSWALSTAEAMWARGDHSDGIKWVRRAAEAASEAENDARALELAKAAADLASMLARLSHQSIDLEDVVPASDPAPPATPQRPPPPPVPKPPPGSVTKQVSTPSRPPPAPARASQAPPAAVKGKPLGTNTRPPPPAKAAAKAAVPTANAGAKDASAKDVGAKDAKKSARRSRENLEAEAAAIVAAMPAGASPGSTLAVAVPAIAERPKPGNDAAARDSAAAWDAAATQNLTGDELPLGPRGGADGDRLTAVMPPAAFDPRATMQARAVPGKAATPSAPPPSQSSPPATVVGTMLPHVHALAAPAAPTNASVTPHSRGAAERHDPGIITSQAVRVVVWRDGNGVHVAPAGTVVSAITVDAVLVALEPSADLTAWLSQRKG